MLPTYNEKADSFNLVDEESKQLQVETLGGSLEKSLTILENIPSQPKLLAWSSWMDNKINIAELETKQEFTNFDGAKLNKTDVYSWTHVKEIANPGLLVSVHHNEYKSANLEVFDASRKGQTKKIYSFEEVSGITGNGDVAYNPRRRFLGAMCVRGKIAYQLYSFDTWKSDCIVKLIRKSRWHAQYSTRKYNYITSLDFNPNGETVATIDKYGVCLISDLSTNSYHFHLKMEMKNEDDFVGRCRWSTNPDEPLLFVKYDEKLLNILDVEKKDLILKSQVRVDSRGMAYWIDVCQSDGTLLAAASEDKKVRIFDKRMSQVVQTFDDIHTNQINCVRWSPSGDMLATASYDKTAALLDFKTGKKLYSGKTSDGSKFTLVCD